MASLPGQGPEKEATTSSSAGDDITQPGSFGSKSIGLLGSVMLLTNNLAGPTVVLMPALAQEAGWLAMIATMIFLAELSAICGTMLLAAMRNIPGNEDFSLRVEYHDIVRNYFPDPIATLAIFCYHSYLTLTLMSYIISSAQVLDFAAMDFFGCAYGLELWPQISTLCGSTEDSSTPFGQVIVVPGSFLLVALICTPFAVKNLDDNVALQVFAIVGFTGIAGLWIYIMEKEFFSRSVPTPLPMATKSQGNLFSTLLFNFAFMSTIPSWANEKHSKVSVGWSFCLTMSYLVVVYATIGIVGGLAYPPYFDTDATLFSKLNGSGSRMAEISVIAYPMLQNFTSIPVFSVLIRYNLNQAGWSARVSTVMAVGMPWVLSIPFYTGKGFENLSEVGGLWTSSVINFIVPVAVYCISRQRLHRRKFLEGENGIRYNPVPVSDP
mmetsp:Transcript_85333/g.151193  ORF Transcript_85333/g.151193 Transcript_85333/m.151193 type:complete len:437 (-) Transcript_85333:107-1417(-)